MASRRAGVYPRSWVDAASALPATCSASSTPGVYAPAVAAGAPAVTAEGTCTSTVRFQVNATTYYGENVGLFGNVSELGSWAAANGQSMSADGYTEARPLWSVDVAMLAGEVVSYGYVKVQNCNQGWVFETVNRTLVVPACVTGGNKTDVLLTVDEAWTGPDGTSGNC